MNVNVNVNVNVDVNVNVQCTPYVELGRDRSYSVQYSVG